MKYHDLFSAKMLPPDSVAKKAFDEPRELEGGGLNRGFWK